MSGLNNDGSSDAFQQWLRREREIIQQEDLERALIDFDPNWKMMSGDDLSDYDYEFLASCNVSWEYNNKENADGNTN